MRPTKIDIICGGCFFGEIRVNDATACENYLVDFPFVCLFGKNVNHPTHWMGSPFPLFCSCVLEPGALTELILKFHKSRVGGRLEAELYEIHKEIRKNGKFSCMVLWCRRESSSL